ncbi:MAG TPA: hypothetical protein VGB04_08745 [Allosphingosinicella sp.]|jgi:hypothetical protein
MTEFDPAGFQERPNGPLKPELIARMLALKNKLGLSYAALAAPSGLSGAFFHHLINKNGNVGTQHVAKIVAAVEQLESGKAQATASAPSAATVAHTYHLRPDMQVVLHLPGDLSSKEADRLSKFISSLPMA